MSIGESSTRRNFIEAMCFFSWCLKVSQVATNDIENLATRYLLELDYLITETNADSDLKQKNHAIVENDLENVPRDSYHRKVQSSTRYGLTLLEDRYVKTKKPSTKNLYFHMMFKPSIIENIDEVIFLMVSYELLHDEKNQNWENVQHLAETWKFKFRQRQKNQLEQLSQLMKFNLISSVTKRNGKTIAFWYPLMRSASYL